MGLPAVVSFLILFLYFIAGYLVITLSQVIKSARKFGASQIRIIYGGDQNRSAIT